MPEISESQSDSMPIFGLMNDGFMMGTMLAWTIQAGATGFEPVTY